MSDADDIEVLEGIRAIGRSRRLFALFGVIMGIGMIVHGVAALGASQAAYQMKNA